MVFVKGCFQRVKRAINPTNRWRQLPDKPKVFQPSSPLATLGVPGSGCVLYGFAAGLARAILKKFSKSSS
ncbi:hypothetical protein P8631_13295, partial [Guyparkeria sp. 1SP6A2]|nr:hypothetical protein [Guyparkeria sp. 1SP6A2]